MIKKNLSSLVAIQKREKLVLKLGMHVSKFKKLDIE